MAATASSPISPVLVVDRLNYFGNSYWIEESRGKALFRRSETIQVQLPGATTTFALSKEEWCRARKSLVQPAGIHARLFYRSAAPIDDVTLSSAMEWSSSTTTVELTASTEDGCFPPPPPATTAVAEESFFASIQPLSPSKKRPHEEGEAINDIRESKRARPNNEPQKPWFVRVAVLQPAGSEKRYGIRASVPVSSFLSQKDDLIHYSLIIPAFTLRQDVPSTKEKQRGLEWLWNTYEHPRYFGLLDIDMDLDAVVKGLAPLFKNDPPVQMDKTSVKKAFAQRLVNGSTFGQLISACPAFALLYYTVRALLSALEVEHVAYFSGGGGFRVLFHSPLAWRRVTWGHAYAQVFHDQELPKLLQHVAPRLPPQALAQILKCTDKNVYDCDKGTKPDLLAHFDTNVYPRRLTSTFESARPDCNTDDEPLSEAIRDFWQRIFETVSDDDNHVQRLVAPVVEPALIYYPQQALYQFPRSPVAKATHLVYQGNLTSYRCVDDVEQLYQLILQQRRTGIPVNAHEIRTRVTRHAIDYDGGPPLLDPMQRHDTGEMQTPLGALQEIHQSSVLANQETFPGILLSCRPRPNTTATRAHLIWPNWHIRMVDEKRIVRILQQGMRLRWPDHDWLGLIESPILESPTKLRMLFSDTVDKVTGFMANRALRFDTMFDGGGVPLEMDVTDDIKLLRLCSLRLSPEEKTTAPLLLGGNEPDERTHEAEDTSTSSMLAKLEPTQREAVLATCQRALEDVRLKHGKPRAQFYKQSTMHVSLKYRRVEWGILSHQQCTSAKAHKSNNVKLLLHMDRDVWELRCFKPGCPQHDQADRAWGRGTIDTSALRAAWPLPPPPPPPPLEVL